MLRLVAGLGVLLSLCAACGGSTSGGGSTSEAGEGEGDGASTPGATKDTPGASDSPNADTELGDCKLGPTAYGEGASPCPWVADNRCYSVRAMACNCACPRDRDSQCLSSSESGPEGRVEVDCF